MIDPAIIDVMHHMSQQPPAVVETAPPAAAAPSRLDVWLRTVGERSVREFEAEVSVWSAACDRQVADLFEAFKKGPVEDHHLAMLLRMIDLFDANVDRDATAYRRTKKRSHRLVKQAKALPAGAYEVIRAQQERVLDGLARWGLARVHGIFGLRALYAQYHPSGRAGPTFDDPKALGDYLRAAVA